MNKRAKTHVELFHALLESMQGLVNAIELKNASLKKYKDYDEITQLHKTTVIIRRWFFDQGGIAL